MTQWTTGQAAKKLSISIRTLRYYDQIGLLCPSNKDEYGKRFYSEADLVELEKIMLLRSLGLSLDEISHLLRTISYRGVLSAHHNALQEQLTTIQQQIAQTVSFINMVDLEGTLPWGKVSELVRQAKKTPKKWIDYFDEEEQKFLNETLPRLESGDRLTQQYVSLLRRIEWCLAHGLTPQSKEGQAIAKELSVLVEQTFGGDKELEDKFWEIRKLPSEQSGLYPLSDEVLTFVEECMDTVQK